MNKTYQLGATAAFGLEGVVAGELKRLGYENAKGFHGGATFEGTLTDAFRANLWLRTADRVLIYFGRFKAVSFEELFERVKALPWEELLPRNAQVYVTGKCARSKLMSVPDVQSISKKAIVERMKAAYSLNWLPEDGARYHIDVHLHEDEAAVTVDTSGAGLSRRGYRTLNAEAPLRETLAAAMLITSPWRPWLPLYDPLCGSGTLPIEAAMIALDRAPGLTRAFDMEKWDGVDADAFAALRSEARTRFETAKKERTVDISGSDIDERVLRLASAHRAQAGLNDFIRLQHKPVSQAQLTAPRGAVVTNLPYGERLGDKKSAEAVCRDLSALMRGHDDWTLTAISSDRDFEKVYGRRCTKKRRVFNGRIECEILTYIPTSDRVAKERRPVKDRGEGDNNKRR